MSQIKFSANPWLDFASYQYTDEYRFKGRGEDIAKFKLIMDNGTMSVLYADSGIGKTSFINAGIEPVFVKRGYMPIHILFNEDIFNSDVEIEKWLISDIESKFYEIIKDSDSEKEDKRQIEEWCYLHSDEFSEIEELKNNLWWRLHAYKIKNLRNGEILKPLIVFDQFEEVFIKGKESFLESLFSIIEQVSSSTLPDAVRCVLDEKEEFEDLEINRQHNFKVLFSLRKDYLSEFDYWCNDRYSITELFQNRMLLKALSREQARQVICNQDGVDTLDEVADDIIEKIDDKHHNVVEPFILSVFCSRLYEKAISLNKEILKKEDLAQVDIKNIIRSFYEEKILSLIPNEGHRLAFETTLVDEDGFRKRERIASRKLAKIGFEKTYAKPLEDAHLIRIITINDAKCVEIVHDRIAEVISEQNKQREREKQAALEKAEAERKQRELEEKAARERAEAERRQREIEEKAARERHEAELRQKALEEKAAREKLEAEIKQREIEVKAALEKAEADLKTRKLSIRLIISLIIAVVLCGFWYNADVKERKAQYAEKEALAAKKDADSARIKEENARKKAEDEARNAQSATEEAIKAREDAQNAAKAAEEAKKAAQEKEQEARLNNSQMVSQSKVIGNLRKQNANLEKENEKLKEENENLKKDKKSNSSGDIMENKSETEKFVEKLEKIGKDYPDLQNATEDIKKRIVR